MSSSTPLSEQVNVVAAGRTLFGELRVPAAAKGVILFAHGSGSGRFSPRNQAVARSLESMALATLLIDLLEEEEAEDRRNVFDIPLLAERVAGAARWLGTEVRTRRLPLGLFGASTGAAAALVCAAREPVRVGAVVSRGGRPDLAWDELPAVQAPTLLIVGGRDQEVLELNERALECLSCPKKLVVVPGATHLFPEPGALETVADLAGHWFLRHLVVFPSGEVRHVS